MKTLVITSIGILFSAVSGLAQNRSDLDSLIKTSIEKHIALREQQIKERTIIANYLDEIIFFPENFPSDFHFPIANSNKSHTSFLDYSRYSRKKLEKGIRVFRLLPINLKNDSLSIVISDEFVIKKGSNINISTGIGSIYQYRYSCITKQWELLAVKDFGI